MVAHANLYDICMRFSHLRTRLTTAVNFSFFFAYPRVLDTLYFFSFILFRYMSVRINE